MNWSAGLVVVPAEVFKKISKEAPTWVLPNYIMRLIRSPGGDNAFSGVRSVTAMHKAVEELAVSDLCLESGAGENTEAAEVKENPLDVVNNIPDGEARIASIGGVAKFIVCNKKNCFLAKKVDGLWMLAVTLRSKSSTDGGIATQFASLV